MNTSYNNNITYGDLIEGMTHSVSPKNIVEIGILEGYSLEHFAKGSAKNTVIKAYDIFDEFNGNHANKDVLINKFNKYPNITINYGDFYKLHEELDLCDIIHIDIANNGDVFEYAIKNYLPKLSEKGVMILEGGSEERDNIGWMTKYNKPKIQPIIKKYNLKVLGRFPSITIVRKDAL
jgi:predicted O-methyltransferase YrrM